MAPMKQRVKPRNSRHPGGREMVPEQKGVSTKAKSGSVPAFEGRAL